MCAQWLISVVTSEIFADACEPDSYREPLHPPLWVGFLRHSEGGSDNDSHGHHLLSVYYVLCAWLPALYITLSQLILPLTQFVSQWPVSQIQPSHMLCLAHRVLAHIIVGFFFFNVKILPTF